MIKVRFSPEEIRATRLIPEGKYGFVFEKVKEGITREKKDKKFTFTFRGFTGAAKDVPVYRIYTEEYQEFMVALLEKGFNLELDEVEGSDVTLDELYGRKIWLVIKTGEFGGSKRNEMDGFQPWEEGGQEEEQAMAEPFVPSQEAEA